MLEGGALVKFKGIAWLPLLQIVILCTGTLISFIVALKRGDVSVYLPFISETGAESPEMCLFTLTLIFGAAAGCVTIFCRNLVSKHLLINEDIKFLKLNNISTFFGYVSMVGLAGVAAFPMSTVLWAHLLAAIVHFVGGLIYITLETYITYKTPGANTAWKRMRAALCFILLIFLVLLMVFFPLSYFKWKKYNSHPPAMKTPSDQVFGIMFTSAFLEWAMYGTFLTYILTLFLEFRDFYLTVGIVPAPTKFSE